MKIFKMPFLKLLLSNGITRNIYYSFSFSLKNRFRKIFLFKDDKSIGTKQTRTPLIVIYDRDTHHKFLFYTPYRSIFLLNELFYNGQYLRHLNEITGILKKNRDKVRILDLGANIGIFSIYYYYRLIDLKSRLSFYLFEPLPYNLKILKKNLDRNDIEHYLIFQKAVCDKSAESVDLFTGGSYTGPTIIKTEKYVTKQATGKIKVATLKIDDLKLKNVGLIKMDIEGAEELALKGMEKTITANTPILICSYEHQTNNKEFIIKFINNCGDYKYKDDINNKLLYFLPKNQNKKN